MEQRTRLAVVALAAAALAALFGAGSASATTLEIAGITQNKSVTITSSLQVGTTLIVRDTFGFTVTTCVGSRLHGSTTSATTGGKTTHSSYTGEQLTALLTPANEGISFYPCDRQNLIHKSGTLHISHITGTTNGTLTSSGMEVTINSAFGVVSCVTGTSTHLGTLTGLKEGHATIDVNAVIDCSGISTRWTSTYTLTSPTGLGVVA